MILIHLNESHPGHTGRPGKRGGSAPSVLGRLQHLGDVDVNGKKVKHYASDTDTLATTFALKKELGDNSDLVHWGDRERVGYYVPHSSGGYIISKRQGG